MQEPRGSSVRQSGKKSGGRGCRRSDGQGGLRTVSYSQLHLCLYSYVYVCYQCILFRGRRRGNTRGSMGHRFHAALRSLVPPWQSSPPLQGSLPLRNPQGTCGPPRHASKSATYEHTTPTKTFERLLLLGGVVRLSCGCPAGGLRKDALPTP